MFPPVLVSRILLFLLLLFVSFTVPLDLWMLLDRKPVRDYGIKSSEKLIVFLGVPSIVFWLLWFTFALGANGWLQSSFPSLFWENELAQYLGLVFCILGVLIAISARIARGRYAPSWGFHSQVKMATSGPYKFIRHPNYLFYGLMFIGLPLLSGFWPGFLTVIGIYGYVRIIEYEETLLLRHFGSKYAEYQRHTWRLIPLIW